jgi:DNA-binding XRE family transcriptional regulator
MNHLPENLKYLRKSKGMTQQALAEALFINRPVIGAYEEGRAEPKLETVKKIGELFNITLEDLFYTSLSEKISGNTSSNPAKSDVKIPNALKVLSITVDSQDRENIEWVPIKASAGYLNGYSDPEYMSTLPKFQLPMLKGGTLRAFEIKGDSMLPLMSGTFVIGEYLEDYRLLRDGSTYIVISQSEGIVYKRVFRIENEPFLKMVSDNPTYVPYNLPLEDILEIWKAKAFISTRFPEPESENSIEKLSEMLVELQKTMDHLKK